MDEDNRQPEPGIDDIDLEGINLDDINLEDIDLEGIDLEGIDVQGLDFSSLEMEALPELGQANESVYGEDGAGAGQPGDKIKEDKVDIIAEAERLVEGILNEEDVVIPGEELDLDLDLELADPLFAESLEMLNSISPEEFASMGNDRVMAMMDSENDGLSVIDIMIKEQLTELSNMPEASEDVAEEYGQANFGVYELEREVVQEGSVSEKKEKSVPRVILFMLRIPLKYMYIITGALVVLLATTSVFGYTLLFGEQTQRRQFEQAGGILLSQPLGAVNNAYQIFSEGATVAIGGRGIGLILSVFDSRESIFTFDEPLDMRYTNFYIRQDDGQNLRISLQNLELGPTNTLRMQPISEGVQEFTLVSVDTRSRERSEQSFRFDRAMVHPPVRYISEPIEFAASQNGSLAMLRMESGAFSPTSSSVTYTITRNQDIFTPFEISLNDLENGGISLREGFNNLGIAGEPSVVAFEGGAVILANTQFNALRSLAHPIDIEISGVGQNYILNRHFHVPELLGGANPRAVIPMGNYDLFIEGMAHSERHGMFVLVFHTQDSTVELPYYPQDLLGFLNENEGNFRTDISATNAFFRRYGIDPYFNRVETVMTAHILIDTALGQVRIPGRALHDRRGSDILFDIPESAGAVPVGAATLVIEEVDILRPSAERRIELEQAASSPNLFNQSFFNDIVRDFEARLGFKSGTASLEQLGVFDASVFENPADFTRFYAPQPGFDGIYGAELLFGAVHGDRLYAVVREMWLPDIYEPLPFVLTHKVYAQRNHLGIWDITRNEVIDYHILQ